MHLDNFLTLDGFSETEGVDKLPNISKKTGREKLLKCLVTGEERFFKKKKSHPAPRLWVVVLKGPPLERL